MRMQQQNGKYACASKVRVVKNTNADLSSVVEVFTDMDVQLVNSCWKFGAVGSSSQFRTCVCPFCFWGG